MPAEQTGHGWTLLRVAAVNATGTRQKGRPITVVDLEGQQYFRVPILRKASVRYKGRILKFDQAAFDTILKNHQDEVWDSAPYLRASHETGDVREDAMGWFDKDAGGFIRQEGDQLIGYCKPTGDDMLTAVKNLRRRYASADLHPDYQSAQVTPLEGVISTINFEELSDGELIHLEEPQEGVEPMSDDTKDMVPKSDLDNLAAEKADLEKKVSDLEAKIKELTPEPELELPQAAKDQIARLEAQIASQTKAFEAQQVKLAADAKKAKVDALVAQWNTPVSGKVHAAYVINNAKAMLMFEPVGEGEQVVKFEADQENGLEAYVFEALIKFVDGLPRSAAVDSTTHFEENPMSAVPQVYAANGIDYKTAAKKAQGVDDKGGN